MSCLLEFLKMLCLTLITRSSTYDLKVGIVAPVDHPYYNTYIGLGTSVGAVGFAIDAINREQLLPDANISDQPCSEFEAADIVFDMLNRQKVNVLLGPGCPQTAILAGIVGANANTPLMSWSATDPELEDLARFPTFSLVINTGAKIGYVMKAILEFFEWRNVALISNDDYLFRKCFFAKQGLSDSLSSSNIGLVTVYETRYRDEIPQFEFEKFLKLAVLDARVIIVCLDLQSDRRRFMLYAYKYGYTSDQFVYIIPHFISDTNTLQPWVDYSDTPDGMDDTAAIAYRRVVVVEVANDPAKVNNFREKLIDRAKGAPINYSPKPTDLVGSAYSPFLYDSMYLYAIALNITLQQGGNITEGVQIFNNTFNLTFTGIMGNVSIDSIGERSPVFTIKTFDINNNYRVFGSVSLNGISAYSVKLFAPESQLWSQWNGKRPLATPLCGFDGSICREHTMMVNGICGTVGTIVAIMLAVGIPYNVYRLRTQEQFCEKTWKIDKSSLGDLRTSSRTTSTIAVCSFASQMTLNSVSSDSKLKNLDLPENRSLVTLNSEIVWLRKFIVEETQLTHIPDHLEFVQMRKFNHDNINTFLGINVTSTKEFSVAWKFCPKFSLQEVLRSDNFKLDWFFKLSILNDLTDGLSYIHNSPLKSHGYLKSKNVLMDGRWMVKLTDYGLSTFRVREMNIPEPAELLWTAPELLRMTTDERPSLGTQKGDVYSLGIIIQEVITESRPYENSLTVDEPLNAEKIIHKLKNGSPPVTRPRIDTQICREVDPRLIALAQECWDEKPKYRPDTKAIKATLKKMHKSKNENVMDHVMDIMEKYAETLENTVKERTNQLAEEKKRCDQLLYRMLPQTIAEKLKSGQQLDPEQYESATVFFSDVVGFTVLSGKSTPIQVVSMLNQLYTLFDDTIAAFDVYKVETIGDAYLCVSGVPHRNGDKHVPEIADFSLLLNHKIANVKLSHLEDDTVQLRIGICSGVVGLAMPHYCLFGDTVNTASRMESHGSPGKIQITSSTHKILDEIGYRTECRGEIFIKGKGMMSTYWLFDKPKLSL